MGRRLQVGRPAASSTRSVPGDIHDDPDAWLKLSYDRETKDLYVNDPNDLNSYNRVYNPAELGLEYTLTTADGTVYQIDSASGRLASATDANGNETLYSDGQATAGNYKLKVERGGPGGTVSKVQVMQVSGTTETPVGAPVLYAVDPATLNLTAVTDQAGHTTTYAYEEAGRPHHLTKVIDPRGVPAFTAKYDGHGNVAREIRSVKDAAGNLLGYAVAVRDHAYHDADVTRELDDLFVPGDGPSDPVQPGSSNQNLIASMREWQTFEVAGADPQGLRYTRRPTALARETFFADSTDPAERMPSRTVEFLADGRQRVTRYGGYELGKPGTVAVALEVPGNNPDMPQSSTPVSSDRFTYDAAGNLLHAFNALGEGTEFVYTNKGTHPDLPAGLLLETYRVRAGDGPNAAPVKLTAEPDVRNVYYGQADVDAGVSALVKGLLKSTTDAAGVTTRYTYQDDGKPKETFREWTDAAGVAHSVRPSLTEYDTAGRAWRTTDAQGQVTTTGYDVLGKVAQTTDVFGGVTTNAYDVRGNLIRTQYPDGTETRSVYDVMGRVEWATERFKPADPANLANPADKVVATRTIYDSLGRAAATERYADAIVHIASDGRFGSGVLLEKSELGAAGTLISSTSSVYDAAGRVVETKDASGLRSGTVYYSDGRVHYAGPLKPDAPADWHRAADPSVHFVQQGGRALVTTYGYDLSDAAGLYDATTDALGRTTKTYKDAFSAASKTVFADGSFVETISGINGAAVSRADLPLPTAAEGWSGVPAGGRHEVKVAQRKANDPVTATHHLYDRLGRLTDVWQPAVDDATTPATNLVRPHWRYAYDANGNQTSQTDPRGKVTSFAYDEQGRRVSRTLPPDSDGNTANDTETWTYDVRGRIDVHTDFKGQSTKQIYETDARYGGRLKEEQRFAGAVDSTPDESTEQTFDALGRRTTVTEKANLDADDLTPLQVTRTETTGYDPLTGTVILTASPEGVVRHTYDPATGRLTATWTAPSETSVADLATARTSAHTLTEFEYNYLGQLWKMKAVRLNGGAVPTAQQTTTSAYDAVENLDTTSLPNGIVEDYNYDVLNRLDTLTAKRGATTVFSQDYDVRADGQRAGVSETREGGATVRIDWTYDGLNRLASENYNSSDNTKDYAATFTFDLAGNRAKKVQTGSFQPATTTYAYNDRDQLTSEVAGSTTTNHTYDANGSTTVKGAESFAWDLRNRMKSATIGGVATVYTYDRSGIRVREKTGADDVYYLTSNVNPTGYAQTIEQWKVGNPAADASYAWDRDLVSQTRAGVTTYYVQDGLGSTRALTNGSGVVTDTLDYAAYGKVITRSGVTPNVYEYAGEHVDGRIGQSFNRARWHNLDGRWTSEDPAEFAPGDLANANQYLYVGANPNNGTDPSGEVGVIQTLAANAIGFAMRFSDAAKSITARYAMKSHRANGGLATVVRHVLGS